MIVQCDYCGKYFSERFKRNKFSKNSCCEHHKIQLSKGLTLCQCCEKHTKRPNQIVCKWCHK